MPARAGRNAGTDADRVERALQALRTHVRSEMRRNVAPVAGWHRDCVDRECTCGRTRSSADVRGHNGMLCSLSSSCLAVCGLIPLSRAKESYGHAHGWYGERSVGPWYMRRHSLRARLARPHARAHDVSQAVSQAVSQDVPRAVPRILSPPSRPPRGGGGRFGDGTLMRRRIRPGEVPDFHPPQSSGRRPMRSHPRRPDRARAAPALTGAHAGVSFRRLPARHGAQDGR
jgi:hypothetical protein